MEEINESDIEKGQAIYTPLLLKIYNLWVLDISNRWIWRCPKSIQLTQFNQYVSNNHLDIGVGTGYYLKSCQSPNLSEVSLMDLNPNCLESTRELLEAKGITPSIYQADIFNTPSSLSDKFSSISMNYLLHCLPGTMGVKEKCIENAVSMLKPGGTLFGATILSDEPLHTGIARKLCAFYNKKSIFSNQHDSFDALKSVLKKHLVDLNISVYGCVALFNGLKMQ